MKTMRTKILSDINLERDRQDALHPQDLTLAMRFVTIMEEAGEVAEALQEKDYEQAYKELIETASCCVRMAEDLIVKTYIPKYVEYNDLSEKERKAFNEKLQNWFD